MAAEARRRGAMHINIIIVVVLAILCCVITAHIYWHEIKEDYADKAVFNFFDTISNRNCAKDCILAAEKSFSKDEKYSFIVDFGDIEIKNVKYFGLGMECPFFRPLNAIKIEDWMITCENTHEGKSEVVKLFDGPMPTETMCGLQDGASIQFLGSKGYETEIDCDNKVTLSVKIKDHVFSGSSADMYLCYVADR